MNLLEETKGTLKAARKTPKDVKWCGSPAFGYFSWAAFSRLADFEYDAGFGSAKIAQDLVVVGDGFWLERCEYDGSEGWEFKELPIKPEKQRTPSRLGGSDVMWENLEEIDKTNNK